MTSYVAYLRKEPDSDYGVDFPDLPGCVTAGASVEEAQAMAAEALAAHLAFLEAEGRDIPAPRSLEAFRDDPDRPGAIALLVTLDRDLLKPERINVSLPKSLIRRIDAVADNRSKFLADAAEQKLAG